MFSGPLIFAVLATMPKPMVQLQEDGAEMACASADYFFQLNLGVGITAEVANTTMSLREGRGDWVSQPANATIADEQGLTVFVDAPTGKSVPFRIYLTLDIALYDTASSKYSMQTLEAELFFLPDERGCMKPVSGSDYSEVVDPHQVVRQRRNGVDYEVRAGQGVVLGDDIAAAENRVYGSAIDLPAPGTKSDDDGSEK